MYAKYDPNPPILSQDIERKPILAISPAASDNFFFSKNSHFDLDLGPRTLKHEYVQDKIIQHICLKLNQNRSINEGSRHNNVFLKIATVTLTLAIEPSSLNLSKKLSYYIFV